LFQYKFDGLCQNNSLTDCGACKQSKKAFGGAAKQLNGQVTFGAVDCDEQRNVSYLKPENIPK